MQLLADHGPLTRGLADMVTEQARALGRILLVPVTGVEDPAAHAGDTLVQIGALAPTDFARLLFLVLQGEPTAELQAELYEETRGLPGLAARAVRTRMASGDLTWTMNGVGSARPGRIPGRVISALLSVPFALLGLFGVEAVTEVEIEQRGSKRVLVAA